MSRRRRANSRGQARAKRQTVLVTEEELLRLRERADDAGVTVPRLLLESALGAGGGAVPELRAIGKHLMAAHREISGAAVNLNQIAKKANTTHEIPTDFDAAVRELRATHLLLTQATNAVIETLSGPGAGVTAQPGGEPVDCEVGEG